MSRDRKEVADLDVSRRVVVRLPHQLVDALDVVAGQRGRHRSDVIRESVEFFLAEQERQTIRQQLIQGYQELGQLDIPSEPEELWDVCGSHRD
jgi:CopG family transcriptional regulator/antitoxin EndoAI